MATVPACSSCTFTNVLPHRNVMPQNTTPIRHSKQNRPVGASSIDVQRHTGSHNYPLCNVLDIIRSQRSTCLKVAFSVKLGRKCALPSDPRTRNLWRVNPIRYLLPHPLCLTIEIIYVIYTNSHTDEYLIYFLVWKITHFNLNISLLKTSLNFQQLTI